MCYLLDDTKLHIFEIITAACMISVMSYLTQHADGFKYWFFQNAISQGETQTQPQGGGNYLQKGAERSRSLICGHTPELASISAM